MGIRHCSVPHYTISPTMHSRGLLLTVLAAASASLVASLPSPPSLQIPFSANTSPNVNPANGLVRVEQDDEEYSVFSHKHFPGHKIRAIQPKGFCDTAVEQWSGYLDTPNSRHFYFWFFESRNDPANDPVVLWLNGGPGCSSFTGLLMELGPCRVQPADAKGKVIVEENPWSWNRNASIIFLDQPVGVGYSYSDKGVWTTEAAAKDVHAFLQIWFNAFKKDFGSNSFHIAGESFAGRYIPVFSDYIVEQNKKDNGLRKINLASVLIGNGMTAPQTQYAYYHTAACTTQSGYGPFLTAQVCDTMAAQLPKCQKLMKKCADNPSDSIDCLSATTYCEATQTEPFYQTGRNAYDMEKFGEYDEEAYMHTFLNQKSTLHTLGVDKESHGRVKNHTGCDPTVGYKFSATGDGAKPSYPHVANILNNGVSALLYSGDRDFICNWMGNQDWVHNLEWNGKEGFQKTVLSPWFANKDEPEAVSGQFRTHGNLTFATVAKSGHFVPFDKPQESLNMANAWLHYGPAAFAELLSKKAPKEE